MNEVICRSLSLQTKNILKFNAFVGLFSYLAQNLINENSLN